MALDFIAGCLGGCAGVAIGHPFDTIKVKLQTQNFRNPVYRGSWDCLTKILQTESLAGVYRGVWSPMCGVALVNTVVFGVYMNLQRNTTEPDSLRSHFLAGATAGLAQSVISSPVELLKTRVQTSSSYNGTMDWLVNILKKEGIQGVFKGLSITGARESMSYGFYFTTYEVLTRNSSEASLGTPAMLLAGGTSGTVSCMLTHPLDVIKTRFQADKGTYSGYADCLRKSVQNEGLSCLSRGLMPTILRAFPTNAVTFTVVTWVMRMADFSANESVSLKNIVDSVAEKIPNEKHLITSELQSVCSLKFHWFRGMNAQKYFSMSEDSRMDDDSSVDTLYRKYDNHKDNVTNKLEADLLAAELKLFDDLANEIKENDSEFYSKLLRIKGDFKKDNR